MLAPPSHKIFGYITGWLTVAGWQATFASGCFLCGTLIQGLMVLTNPNYNPLPWQGTLLYWAVVMFCVFINVAARGLLPKFEGLILLLHVTGFFAIIIPLIYLSDHSTTSEVFTTFLNGGNWPNQGLSLLVGMLGNVFAFTGADAATHVSTQCTFASLRCLRWHLRVSLANTPSTDV
jgi:L-asparagine transporter-like permease